MSNRYIIQLMGLDKDYNLLCLFNYINLQWTRSYYSPGSFSVQIPLDQYNKDIKYVYTPDRPELGEVEGIRYDFKQGQSLVTISGNFIENRLNDMVVYAPFTNSNITSDPGWVVQEGKAEDVAIAYFNAFKTITFTQDNTSITRALDIDFIDESQHRGHDSVRHRLNDYLGNKLYSILKPRYLAPRIYFDYENAHLYLKIFEGRDKTSSTTTDNPVVFSSVYGNIRDLDIVVSSLNYKNGFIINSTVEDNDEGTTNVYEYAADRSLPADTRYRFQSIESQTNINDFNTQEAFISALMDEGDTELNNHKMTISFDFDVVVGDESGKTYQYLTDFDLGDRCSIEVPEVQLSEDAVLSKCIEVIKNGVWSMTVEFDV